MRFHIFQHEPHEGAGTIERWLAPRLEDPGSTLTRTLWQGAVEPPPVEEIDLLVVMGGSMSVDEEDRHPWLIREKLFIEQAVKKGRKVLGVCLGAQLLACVLGARVYRNKSREIGWFPVLTSPEARKRDLYQSFPERFTAFHWHGDTFEIPYGGLRTFSSECTPNQGFQFGNSVVALQFHIECSEELVRGFVDSAGESELRKERFVQPGREILRQAGEGQENYRLLSSLLDRLVAQS